MAHHKALHFALSICKVEQIHLSRYGQTRLGLCLCPHHRFHLAGALLYSSLAGRFFWLFFLFFLLFPFFLLFLFLQVFENFRFNFLLRFEAIMGSSRASSRISLEASLDKLKVCQIKCYSGMVKCKVHPLVACILILITKTVINISTH